MSASSSSSVTLTPGSLPIELWWTIRDYIESPSHLTALALTSRYFAEVTRPVLDLHVLLAGENLSHALAELRRHPEREPRIRTLSFANDSMMTMPDDIQPISRFSRIEVLSFERVHLPPTLYSELALLPELTALSLRACDLTDVIPTPRKNENLRLRVLRINKVFWDATSTNQRNAMCALACTAQLDYLDVHANLARMIFNRIASTSQRLQRPIVLRTLMIDPHQNSPGNFELVAEFLLNTPSIEALHLLSVPLTASLPDAALPNLRVLMGPRHCITAFVARRPVERLCILDQETPGHFNWFEILTVADSVTDLRPPLRQIEIRVSPWKGGQWGVLPRLDIETYLRGLHFTGLRGDRSDRRHISFDQLVHQTSQAVLPLVIKDRRYIRRRLPHLQEWHMPDRRYIALDQLVNQSSQDALPLLIKNLGDIGRRLPHLQEFTVSSDVVWRKRGAGGWLKTDRDSSPSAGFYYDSE